jgi:hypothetical protein
LFFSVSPRRDDLRPGTGKGNPQDSAQKNMTKNMTTAGLLLPFPEIAC